MKNNIKTKTFNIYTFNDFKSVRGIQNLTKVPPFCYYRHCTFYKTIFASNKLSNYLWPKLYKGTTKVCLPKILFYFQFYKSNYMAYEIRRLDTTFARALQ